MIPPLIRLIGLDQKQIAREAGIHPVTISRILRGHILPSERTVLRLESAILKHLVVEVK